MMNRDPEREMPSSREQAAREKERQFRDRLSLFKRVYRWLNLTLVQSGSWPLLLALGWVPAGPVATTPMPVYLLRLAGPALAALLAWGYLRQRPEGVALPPEDPPMPTGAGAGASALRVQAAWLLVGVAGMLAAARIVAGPAEPALKLVLFGIADVAAFQAIHFGVVRRSWPDPEAGAIAAVGLFAASFGLRQIFAAMTAPAAMSAGAGVSPGLAFGVGAVAGLLLALLSLGLRRWPGGWLPAAAAQLIVTYLALGFA